MLENTENNLDKKAKPKQYTHIDYEALLIYVMKKNISVNEAIERLDLDIARSTVVRNVKKIKDKCEKNEIIDLYQNRYVPNMQKEELPENIKQAIDDLELRDVIKKKEIDDLYKKLSYMKQILDSCNGNRAEAARVISNGNTILGNTKITTQGLRKNMQYYEVVKKEYETQNKTEEQKGERK